LTAVNSFTAIQSLPQPLRQSGITLGLFPYCLGQQGAIAVEIEAGLGAGDAGIDQLAGQQRWHRRSRGAASGWATEPAGCRPAAQTRPSTGQFRRAGRAPYRRCRGRPRGRCAPPSQGDRHTSRHHGQSGQPVTGPIRAVH